MPFVRAPAVAGLFYPADPPTLRSLVRQLLSAARPAALPPERPEALIVPHAGYPYSGPVAASGYVRLEPWRGTFARVVLVGPAHHAAFDGLAASTASAFATPLGELRVERLPEAAASRFAIVACDRAHAPEHCLEVQLPFLAEVLGDHVSILPLLTGRVAPAEVADALLDLWAPDTLVVVSSDLSHYLPYREARLRDAATAAAIERLEPAFVRSGDACGHTAVQALLLAARSRQLAAHAADLRNSGDTGGSRREVVGYGAFVFAPPCTAHHYPVTTPNREDS